MWWLTSEQHDKLMELWYASNKSAGDLALMAMNATQDNDTRQAILEQYKVVLEEIGRFYLFASSMDGRKEESIYAD